MIENNSKSWFIKGNCPSLKNSKVKTSSGIFASKTVTKYLRGLGIQSYSSSRKIVKGYTDKNRPNIFLESLEGFKESITDYPIKLGFYFIRDSKRKFDFNNANQLINDLLTAHDLIEDDNVDFILPYPILNDTGNCYEVDKDNAGVIIQILE